MVTTTSQYLGFVKVYMAERACANVYDGGGGIPVAAMGGDGTRFSQVKAK